MTCVYGECDLDGVGGASAHRMRCDFSSLSVIRSERRRHIYTLKELSRRVVRCLLKRELVAVNPMEEEYVYIDGSTMRGYKVSLTAAGEAHYQKLWRLSASGWHSVSTGWLNTGEA